MIDPEQPDLLSVPPDWRVAWKSMPEFEQKDLMPWKTVLFHYKCHDDLMDFAKLIGQKLTPDTQSAWHPKLEFRRVIGREAYFSTKPEDGLSWDWDRAPKNIK